MDESGAADSGAPNPRPGVFQDMVDARMQVAGEWGAADSGAPIGVPRAALGDAGLAAAQSAGEKTCQISGTFESRLVKLLVRLLVECSASRLAAASRPGSSSPGSSSPEVGAGAQRAFARNVRSAAHPLVNCVCSL